VTWFVALAGNSESALKRRLVEVGRFRVSFAIQIPAPRFIRSCSDGFPMAKSMKKAETVFLVCEETGDYNYTLKRKPGGEKLRLKKYCPRVRKHTWHAEKKK
jgi:large subunit ribosomal protein L33